MRPPFHPERFLVAVFLLLIFGVPLSQAVIELSGGDRVQALQVFHTRPTAKQLRAYEHDLEDASFWASRLRPMAQFARFAWFRDGGDKAIIGRDGWLFYGPGVRYVTERCGLAGLPGAADAFAAIVDFRDQLRERGIDLIVVPVPNKESVYPEKLTARARPVVIPSEESRALLEALQAAGVSVVNLFEAFAAAKKEGHPEPALYLARDSHWSPAGLELAARVVAQHIARIGCVPAGTTRYETRPVEVSRAGDILRMLQVPALEKQSVPERLACRQVTGPAGQPYKDSLDSKVLVLGDSFLRIYQTDEPGSAGFVSHLARELSQPVASVISDGGASTLVRQELHRRPALLQGKRIVLWEFVERDIRLGREGWEIIRLPREAAGLSRSPKSVDTRTRSY